MIDLRKALLNTMKKVILILLCLALTLNFASAVAETAEKTAIGTISMNGAFELHGVLPEECVYIGDSNVDVFTAQNAGVKMAGVSWGFRGKAELLGAGAPFVADTAGELLRYILSR